MLHAVVIFHAPLMSTFFASLLFCAVGSDADLFICSPAPGRYLPRHTMSGLFAYFRSDRAKRLVSRKDGLHRFFGLSSGEGTSSSSSSSRPTMVPRTEVDEDVMMEISAS